MAMARNMALVNMDAMLTPGAGGPGSSQVKFIYFNETNLAVKSALASSSEDSLGT